MSHERSRTALTQRDLWAVSDREITRILRTCRDAGVWLEAMRKETGQVRLGRIEHVAPEAVTLELQPAPPAVTYPTLSLCIVTANHEGRTLLFLSPVWGFHPARAPGLADRLVLGLPEQAINEDVRSAFRVPVRSQSGLDARLVLEDASAWPIEPVNVSVSGMLFRFPRSEHPELAVGNTVLVRVQLDDEPLEIRGEVRRAGGGRYGVFFPESLKAGEVDPPEALRRLVRRLELDWLSRRKR